MSIDQKAIGVVAAQLMEKLEQKYGEDATIDTVAILVAVDQPAQTTVEFAFSEGTAVHVGIGLLEHVKNHLG
jgi:hypothetical protein